MARKFYESFEQAEPIDKYHGKPLIRRRGFFLPAIDLIGSFIKSLLCMAAIDLIIIGVMALISKPLRDILFNFLLKLFLGN
jgi:hypothetical protein